MNTTYPIYIVSKGRWESRQTSKLFDAEGVDYRIVVEPQEYEEYCKVIDEIKVLKLPFSNLGLGSYPARNFCWEHSIKEGHEKHWVFDDNITQIRRVNKGRKIKCNILKSFEVLESFTDRYSNVGLSSFNYSTFVIAGFSDKKPFLINSRCYSAILIKNDMDVRWRMKYNEDIDLCLQVLSNKLCTINFNAFVIDKTSTVAKMIGGNQTELYKGNAFEKKVLKARSLEMIWGDYCKTITRYGRPHHFVDWKKFKHGLIRRTDIDWKSLKSIELKLEKKSKIKTDSLIQFYNDNK